MCHLYKFITKNQLNLKKETLKSRSHKIINQELITIKSKTADCIQILLLFVTNHVSFINLHQLTTKMTSGQVKFYP